MLKWAVYRKNQEGQGTLNSQTENPDFNTNRHYNEESRRSLDAQAVKKSKKPSRYQRRSMGATNRRNNTKSVDKENINFIGNTPNYYKPGFIKSSENFALKDVSNITPTSITPANNLEKYNYHHTNEKDELCNDLPPTPLSYSRRVREAKKRKLEMSSSNSSDIFTRNLYTYKSERRIKNVDRSLLCTKLSNHSTSEPSLNDLSDRLSATTTSSKSFFNAERCQLKTKYVSTTKMASLGIVEIEYDKDLVINCLEKPLMVNKNEIEQSTLPIFGHSLFTDNPVYLKKNEEVPINIRPLKRTRKKSNDFESSFKSPSVDKRDIHTLIRDGCSPVSLTPLAAKLEALRFSTMSTHNVNIKKRVTPINNVTQYFPKIENPYHLILKDDEASTEMENKFILGRDSVTNSTESTVSTTQMGDITLEKMIDDIIKSTKIIKSKRRILKNIPEPKITVEEEIPSIDTVKDLFVKPQAEHKAGIIKEAKYVNLSRDSSVSPKSTPTKKMIPVHKVNEKLLKNVPIGGFLLDDGDGYNEREVCTPDKLVDVDKEIEQKFNKNINKPLSRSFSLNAKNIVKSNLNNTLSESTPDLYNTLNDKNLRLRRQRCIRKKKTTVSNDSLLKQKQIERTYTKSSLLHTLEMDIPSPALDLQNVSLCEPLNSPFLLNDNLHHNTSNLTNVSHSSLMSHKPISQNIRSRELFGLTLENGIPSPITPAIGLKRQSNVMSEERASKTSKLDEDLIPNDALTPVIEYKSSRRCLTYSPEESSINSSEEKRRSVASNKLERSTDRFQALKATIDLDIKTRHDVVDVHVIRCRDLQRPSGKTEDINAYAKVVITGVHENQTLPTQRSIFQRTSVLYGKREPEFQRHLKLPLPPTVYDHQMLHVSVWHRDKKYRRSEFLGCVSFPLKDAIKSDVNGTYFLQQVSGRQGAAASAPAPVPARDRCASDERVTEHRRNMATDNTETSTSEGAKENQNEKAVAANGPASASGSQAQAVAAALQREADEHLFLRYLELDPPDDPAAPRRAQRNGRTPFTTTRKLVRGTAGGFGFTVVWTRPPRVERVAAGGSAERAGLRAGDYIVFVGNKNVVTANEEDVRNLVKSAGQSLILETFRRVPQNGVGIRRLAQVSIPPPTESTPPAPRSPRAAALTSPAPARPPTACSSTSQSLDRRKLHLPQVTFSKEVGNGIIV